MSAADPEGGTMSDQPTTAPTPDPGAALTRLRLATAPRRGWRSGTAAGRDSGNVRWTCGVCGGDWDDGQAEKHDYRCLSAAILIALAELAALRASLTWALLEIDKAELSPSGSVQWQTNYLTAQRAALTRS